MSTVNESVGKANLIDQDAFAWQRPRTRNTEADFERLVCTADGSISFEVRVVDEDDSMRMLCRVCGREGARLDVWEQE